MKIYTKKGDQGKTSLFGGQQVPKSASRIAAYGTADELNSVIGMILTHTVSEKTTEMLKDLQNDLFVLGADLATPLDNKTRIERIADEHILKLEQQIDAMEEQLPPLRNFILPGGTKAGAGIHFARTVCRRAERHAVECSQEESLSEHSLIFLNRLSDFLFVLGRFENMQSGTTETAWIPNA